MTVTYSDDIATAKCQTLLMLLLTRWRGSVLKLIWRDLLIYLSLFGVLHVLYMWVLNEDQKRVYEKLQQYCRQYEQTIPISFVLGFFVTTVTNRWWDQFQVIPWPYGIAVYVSSTLHGYDEVGRAMRRTIMRYVCLSLTMVFRVLSRRVKARFPKMSDLVDAGLLTNSELVIIDGLETKYPGYSKNFLPIVWASTLVNRARVEGRIRDDFAVKTLIEELNKFRGACGSLMNYKLVCVPLVYVQVVTIAVYTYFVIGLLSHQFTLPDPDKNQTIWLFDYVPLFIIFEFIVYMGWLKVAETMINPFGDDDDDFEVNRLVDRNLIMSFLIVDEMHKEHPELLKDQYWNELPKNLPDNAKEKSNEKDNKAEPQDFFDVPEKASKRRVTVCVPQLDIESSQLSCESVERSLTIPRASVIAASYQNLPRVAVKQSIIERQMEEIRQRDFRLDDDSDSEDDYEPMNSAIIRHSFSSK